MPRHPPKLILGWNLIGSPSVDMDLTHMVANFHDFANDPDMEKTFTLTSDAAWKKFFNFLERALSNREIEFAELTDEQLAELERRCEDAENGANVLTEEEFKAAIQRSLKEHEDNKTHRPRGNGNQCNPHREKSAKP